MNCIRNSQVLLNRLRWLARIDLWRICRSVRDCGRFAQSAFAAEAAPTVDLLNPLSRLKPLLRSICLTCFRG
jgi:hypothetical protein